MAELQVSVPASPALAMLRYAVRLLERHGIRCWLESGTLLSVVRDRALPPRTSVNLGVSGEQLPQLLRLQRRFSLLHKYRLDYDVSGRKWIHGNVCMMYIKPMIALGRGTPWAKITPRFMHDSRARWVDSRVCKAVDAVFYNEFGTVSVNGTRFRIPARVEEYLAARYGDWRTTVRSWDTYRDDRAIIGRAELLALPRKTRWTKPEPFRRKMRLQGRNLVRARRLLADATRALEAHGAKYWLDEGTLLGVVREGELIKWDHDVDISAAGDDIGKVEAACRDLRPGYRVSFHHDRSGRLPQSLRCVKVKFLFGRVSLLLGAEELHLDIWPKYRKDDGYYYWIDSYTPKRAEARYYDSLQRVAYDGRQYPVPAAIDDYLPMRFGDRRTPAQAFDTSLHDLAMYDEPAA